MELLVLVVQFSDMDVGLARTTVRQGKVICIPLLRSAHLLGSLCLRNAHFRPRQDMLRVGQVINHRAPQTENPVEEKDILRRKQKQRMYETSLQQESSPLLLLHVNERMNKTKQSTCSQMSHTFIKELTLVRNSTYFIVLTVSDTGPVVSC
ncbi:hypothetical protein CBL_13458 [Carabus blaptoides fortunei]